MIPFEVWVLFAVLAVMVVALVVAHTRISDRPNEPMPIAGGSVDPMTPVHEHIDEVLAGLGKLEEMIARRPAGAAPIGFAPPKPHRHRFKFASEERTNKVLRRIHVCEEADCPDTWIDEMPEPVLPPKVDA